MAKTGYAKSYPSTLLSFLYAVTYDREVNEAFHSDSAAMMDKFGLSEPVQAAVNAMGSAKDGNQSEKTTAVEGVMKRLGQEILADEYKKIW